MILLCLVTVSLGWRTFPTLGMKGMRVAGRSKNKAELQERKLVRRKMDRFKLVWFAIGGTEGECVTVLQ